MVAKGFNNSLGAKWVSQEIIMAAECQCWAACVGSHEWLGKTWVAKTVLTKSRMPIMHVGCVKSWVAKGLAVSSHDLARGLDKHGSDMNA